MVSRKCFIVILMSVSCLMLFAGTAGKCLGSVSEYTISASSEGKGSISPSGETLVNEGENLTFRMAAVPCGYVVADVLIDGVSVGAVYAYTFTDIAEDHSIHVVFALNDDPFWK